MAMRFSGFRFAIVGAMLAMFTLIAVPAMAQQPTSVNPRASSVTEDQLLRALGSGGGNAIEGRVSIPDAKSGTLIQPGGRDWRQFHEVTLRWIGAIVILGMLALLVVFYLIRGMVRIERGRSGRTIVRFNAFERAVHWMTASCFIVLALSGLNITFGKELLLPLFGPDAFSAMSQWGKYAHNFLSFPFTIGVVVMFLMWLAWQIPDGTDGRWIKEGGGLVGGKHPPARRFNAGQKVIYWVVVFGGAAAAITGYLLMFPFYGTGVAGMQAAQSIHAIVAVLFVATMLAHIYIGTIGMEGAFESMGNGTVDVNWASQHHPLWLDEEQARTGATGQRQPSAQPAE
jgi:formate dehydrogenase subunit gamma